MVSSPPKTSLTDIHKIRYTYITRKGPRDKKNRIVSSHCSLHLLFNERRKITRHFNFKNQPNDGGLDGTFKPRNIYLPRLQNNKTRSQNRSYYRSCRRQV